MKISDGRANKYVRDHGRLVGRTIQIRNKFILLVKDLIGHGLVDLERVGCLIGVVLQRILMRWQRHFARRREQGASEMDDR